MYWELVMLRRLAKVLVFELLRRFPKVLVLGRNFGTLVTSGSDSCSQPIQTISTQRLRNHISYVNTRSCISTLVKEGSNKAEKKYLLKHTQDTTHTFTCCQLCCSSSEREFIEPCVSSRATAFFCCFVTNV